MADGGMGPVVDRSPNANPSRLKRRWSIAAAHPGQHRPGHFSDRQQRRPGDGQSPVLRHAGLPMRRKVRIGDILQKSGEIADISPGGLRTGENPAPRIDYERRQPNGRWLHGDHAIRPAVSSTFRTSPNARKRASIAARCLKSPSPTSQGVIMRDADDNIQQPLVRIAGCARKLLRARVRRTSPDTTIAKTFPATALDRRNGLRDGNGVSRSTALSITAQA